MTTPTIKDALTQAQKYIDGAKVWFTPETMIGADLLRKANETVATVTAALASLESVELPEPFGLFCGVRHDPPKTKEFFGLVAGEVPANKCNLYTADQVRQAIAQAQAQPAQPAQPVNQMLLKLLCNFVEMHGYSSFISDEEKEADKDVIEARTAIAQAQAQPSPVAQEVGGKQQKGEQ
jgi:hypothetical protein